MKLKEIKKVGLHEAFDFVLDLNEAFNARFEQLSWARDSQGRDVGTGLLQGEEFLVIIEPGTWPFEGHVYNFVNCEFDKIVNGVPTTDLQLTSKNASAIIGAVGDALRNRLKHYEFDAALFAATNSVDRRLRIYSRLVQSSLTKILPEFNTTTTVQIAGGQAIIAINSNKVPSSVVNRFIEHLKGVVK